MRTAPAAFTLLVCFIAVSSVGCSSADGGSADGAGAVEGCPPPGPYGSSKGAVTPDLTLYDCAGKPVSLHRLCGRKAGFVYAWAAW